MIRFYDGTVFNAGTQALVNTVNTFGVMGAGIALEFALRYPEMYEDYKIKCENKELNTGRVDYYHVPNGPVIVNFPTKQHYAFPSKLVWVETGLADFAKTYQQENIKSVAFPKLGCANGKLLWSDVKPLMIRYLQPLDIDVVICEASKPEPEGAEKTMVDAYNRFIRGTEDIPVKLSKKQEEALFNHGEIRRFFELRDIPGIKGAPYKRLFDALYEKPEAAPEDPQMNLFAEM